MPTFTDPSRRNEPWNERPDFPQRYMLHDIAQPQNESEGSIEAAVNRLGTFACTISRSTPLVFSETYSEQAECNVWLKMESESPVGSFKVRGAINKAMSLGVAEREAGFVAVSAGNHAQGVAYAARLVNTQADVFMPADTPEIKIAAVEQLGGNVHLVEGDLERTMASGRYFSREHPDKTFFHPYDDDDIIAGQGTVGWELFQDPRVKPTHVITPVGGAGLLAGLVMAADELAKRPTFVAVEPQGAASFNLAHLAGQLTPLENVSTLAEGAAVRQPGELPFRVIQRSHQRVVSRVVSEYDMLRATLTMNETGLQTECTAALGIAALKSFDFAPSDEVVVVITGRHIDVTKLAAIENHCKAAA